ncbi:acyl carrier protein [Sphingomonas phyllosphaerae]|uniref:acyl carrier protein n=1 Tax=Sphingomonas phyllosphaerae TaxID=257003 RepID=UPI0004068B68|nr:acyl carrier protein [Sphingomonas phyllosphaerae]
MSEFYEGMAEILEVDATEINADYELGEAWDSLAIVSTIALVDEVFDKAIGADTLQECRTVGDIEKAAQAA